MSEHANARSGLIAILAIVTLAACSSSGAADAGGAACHQLDAVQCDPPSCYATWADVQTAGGSCAPPHDGRETWGACDRYFLRFVRGLDWASTAYYEKSSGALVANISETNGLDSCAAGASGVPSAVSCPADGGVIDPCAADASRAD
jgi:hypothetical protein